MNWLTSLIDGILALFYMGVLAWAAWKDETRRYMHIIKFLVIMYIAALAFHVVLGLAPSASVLRAFRPMIGVWLFLEALALYVGIKTRK